MGEGKLMWPVCQAVGVGVGRESGQAMVSEPPGFSRIF